MCIRDSRGGRDRTPPGRCRRSGSPGSGTFGGSALVALTPAPGPLPAKSQHHQRVVVPRVRRIDQRSENAVVAGGRQTDLLPDDRLLGAGLLPPGALAIENGAFTLRKGHLPASLTATASRIKDPRPPPGPCRRRTRRPAPPARTTCADRPSNGRARRPTNPGCLLSTSDDADDLLCVDLGG